MRKKRKPLHKPLLIVIGVLLVVFVASLSQGEIFQGTLDVVIEEEGPREESVVIEEEGPKEESVVIEEEGPREESVVYEEEEEPPPEALTFDIAVTDIYLNSNLEAVVELESTIPLDAVELVLTHSRSSSENHNWEAYFKNSQTSVSESEPLEFSGSNPYAYESVIEVCASTKIDGLEDAIETDPTNNCASMTVQHEDTQVDLKMVDLSSISETKKYTEVWNDSGVQLDAYMAMAMLWNTAHTEIVTMDTWEGAISPDETLDFTFAVPDADPGSYDLELCFYPVVEVSGIHELNYDDNCLTMPVEVS